MVSPKINKMRKKYRFGAPAATVTHICALKVLDVNLVHHFWVLLLDLQVDQAVSLLLLLGQEWANGQIAQQGQDTQERQQPEPLRHYRHITNTLHTYCKQRSITCAVLSSPYSRALSLCPKALKSDHLAQTVMCYVTKVNILMLL